ncbi:MAG: hypothetical protein IJF87_08670 [Erysipelotrichaceae bacterium]|nr:hypothetical protein [Erysipelotrichaceae bacterium]
MKGVFITKEFREGMEYPKRIKGETIDYTGTDNSNTVKEAWKNTGRYLNEAIKQNKEELSKQYCV